MVEPINISTSTHEHLTLLDLQLMVRATLESRFTDPVWISAEISEMKVNRSGHCYLNLVEKGKGEGAPRAEARGVIWKSAYANISRKFAEATGAHLSTGIGVLLRVVVTYHEVYGLSLQIVDIDASYTLGEVERRRRECIAQLQRDGVWDMNRELTLPRPTLRIAIVSSATAAGYQDFMNELRRTTYRFGTELFGSLMQGETAEESVIEALHHIAEREEEFDCVVVIRGGGSVSDLALFDSYRIASHIAQFPLPVITGIGHDKDTSVADLVAHTSCKTPTAVATLLCEMADMEMATLEEYSYKLRDMVLARLNNERLTLERSSSEIARQSVVVVNGMQHRLANIEESITTLARTLISGEEQRLRSHLMVVEQSNPEIILRRGFAIVRDADGRTIDPQNIEPGLDVSIEMAAGVIKANVKSKILR
ncbi:MAG: exodeoxyribonuclease VII large subunit [Alistipes sp.]|nr:exodeoxyribonuclease VII large subunit [Alistipes sp.]